MVEKVQDRAAEAYDKAQKLGSDAINHGEGAVNKTQAGLDDLLGETAKTDSSTNVTTDTGGEGDNFFDRVRAATESDKEPGQEATTNAGDASESLFDKIKDKVSDLIAGEDNKK